MAAESGFNAMGQPIPHERMSAAYRALRDEMCPDLDAERAMTLVGAVAAQLERDEPHRAMKAAKDLGLDLTGTYRLMAHLLT